MLNIDDIIKDNITPDGEVLTLREKFLGVRGIMRLADNPALATVKKLVLPANQASDEGAEAHGPGHEEHGFQAGLGPDG